MSPQYTNMAGAVKLFFSNYVNFKGRSTRSEYWWVMLASFILGFVLGIFNAITMDKTTVPPTPSGAYYIILAIFCLATLVPSIALCIRRLHDVGKSGWFLLIALVPFVGSLYLLYLYCKPSDGPNQWGDPAV